MLIRFIVPIFAVAMLFTATACEPDNDEPFDDEGLALNWPSTNPDRYHWNGVADPYFETWTWTLVLPDDNTSFALTMGVYNPGADDPDVRGAFVAATGTDLDAPVYRATSVRDFDASVKERIVVVGDSRGTQADVKAHVRGDSTVSFNFQVDAAEPWDETMGLLTNLPLMSLNWHVGALSAHATGVAAIGDVIYEFTDVPVIEDHFWGDSYPGVTTRILASDFQEEGDAFALFGKNILVGPIEMAEIYLAFQHEGELYEMRSWDLDIIASAWRDESGDLNIDATRGNVRIHALVLDQDQTPIDGLAFDENGLGFAGGIIHDAVVQIDLFRKSEEGWELDGTVVSPLSTLAYGESDEYQDIW